MKAQAGTGELAAAGPSFSCGAARTAVERAICADAGLAAADREMAALFALARVSAFGSGPSNQLAAQREALRDVRGCAKPAAAQPRITQCIGAVYAQRNRELAVAALMVAPDTALAVLRRLDPGAAPVLEATALWAAEPVDADWSAPERAAVRKTTAGLLRPYMTALQQEDEQSYGKSILAEPGSDGLAVNSIEDLFASDRHFAAFLSVLGPYLPQVTPESQLVNDRRTLPCAAIVRHPALLRATGPVFGSTMDNFVFESDCYRTLPSTPALAALDAKLLAGWPECDGTIRFAAYRSYGSATDRARLGLSQHQPKHVGARNVGPKRVEPDRGVTEVEIGKVRRELTAYYATYLGKPPGMAASMADGALSEILAAAHECGG